MVGVLALKVLDWKDFIRDYREHRYTNSKFFQRIRIRKAFCNKILDDGNRVCQQSYMHPLQNKYVHESCISYSFLYCNAIN